jgi:2',3'-cyclic-nucleotide 2'-phosphodiesterase (5'-nucleotidase family)
MLVGKEIHLLSSSDVHSSFYPSNNPDNYSGPPLAGGFAKRSRVLNKIRKECANMLLLDSGDFFAGTLVFENYSGQADVEALKYLGYDALCIGNHETDKGLENLLLQIRKISPHTPALCSNLLHKESRTLIFENNRIFCRDGVTIGVFGIIGNKAYDCTNPDFQSVVEHLSPLETFRRVGSELRELCDIVICLSHSGHNEDLILASEGIVDVLLCGHTHKTYLEEAIIIPNQLCNGLGGTIMHQPPALGGAFTHLVLHVGPQKRLSLVRSCLLWVDASSTEDDPDAAKWFNETYGYTLQEQVNRGIATCAVDFLERDRGTLEQGTSCLGKFIAGFVAHTMGKPIGIANKGGIKTGFSLNESITHGKAVQVLGNNNSLLSLSINGLLLYSLVKSVAQNGELQFFGISYDESAFHSVEDDTTDSPRGVYVLGECIDKEVWYDIAMVEYMWSICLLHRDKYFPHFKGVEITRYYSDVLVSDEKWQQLFVNYLEEMEVLSHDTLEHLHSPHHGRKKSTDFAEPFV